MLGSYRLAVWLLSLVYAVAVALFFLWRGVPLPWELAALVGISIVGWRSGSRRVWLELLPFAQLLLAYRGLNGFAGGLAAGQINILNLIAWEKGLFGVVPSASMQASLFHHSFTPALDAAANLLYLSHFVAPVTVAVVIRASRRDHFWPYMLGFFVLAYLGFATYLLFPAAPPWWATRFGYLTGPDATSLGHFILSPEVMFKTPNPLAAMPSMHCAYPLFMALACRRLWGRKANWLFGLAFGVGVAVVYLGHHYVVDVLAGYGYALATWLLFRRSIGVGP